MIELKEPMIVKKLTIFMMRGSTNGWKDSSIDGTTKSKNRNINNQRDCIIKKYYYRTNVTPMGTIFINSYRLGYNPITQAYE